MLPLLSTSILDTLKILMIGNMLTYSNQMPATFQDMMHAQERYVIIDSIFIPEGDVQCAILNHLYTGKADCSNEFVQKHKVWSKENSDYSRFVSLCKGYDVVYLQSNRMDEPILYDIILSIDQVIDKDAVIILFQNFSKNISDENARRKELDKQLNYYQQHNKSEKVILLSIGDFFDIFSFSDPSMVLDKTGKPTKEGSDMIAQALFEIVRPYIY